MGTPFGLAVLRSTKVRSLRQAPGVNSVERLGYEVLSRPLNVRRTRVESLLHLA